MKARALAAAALWALGASVGAAQQSGEDIVGERKPDLTYVMVDGVGIPDPLTETKGDAARGKAVFFDPAQGGCGACHRIGGEGGGAGSALDDVGGRLSESALRMWIVNPALIDDAATMPAYYTLAPAREGQPARAAPPLPAQAIEDLIAYLDVQTAAPPAPQ